MQLLVLCPISGHPALSFMRALGGRFLKEEARPRHVKKPALRRTEAPRIWYTNKAFCYKDPPPWLRFRPSNEAQEFARQHNLGFWWQAVHVGDWQGMQKALPIGSMTITMSQGHLIPVSSKMYFENYPQALTSMFMSIAAEKNEKEPLWVQLEPIAGGEKPIVRSTTKRKVKAALCRALLARGYDLFGRQKEQHDGNTAQNGVLDGATTSGEDGGGQPALAKDDERSNKKREGVRYELYGTLRIQLRHHRQLAQLPAEVLTEHLSSLVEQRIIPSLERVKR